jgi:hypothetical protein
MAIVITLVLLAAFGLWGSRETRFTDPATPATTMYIVSMVGLLVVVANGI